MKSPRYLCLGLDGVPYTLLRTLADVGVIPNIADLLEAGQHRSIRSAIPEVSSAAWTSFMTGTNPGEHGIYGFFEVNPDNYGLKFSNARDIRVPTLWHRLSERGQRVLVVNVPHTYPAYEINGVMISGFVAPDLAKAIYPPEYYTPMKSMEYEVDVNAWIARKDINEFIDALFRVLKHRIDAVGKLLREEAWDFVMVVFTGTDRLQHYLWDAVEEKTHPLHSRVLDFYHAIDTAVGNLLSVRDEKTTTVLLSDHGFIRVKKEINLNAWLREFGYLSFRSEYPEDLTDMAPESIAFSLDPGRIYINRAERYPRGSLAGADDYARVITQLQKVLESELLIEDESGSMVNPVLRVSRGEEIYEGQALDIAPDLIVQTVPGYDLKGNVRIQSITRKDVLTGVHTLENASFVIHNPPAGFNLSRVNSLQDIVPELFQELLSVS